MRIVKQFQNQREFLYPVIDILDAQGKLSTIPT